MSKQGNFIGVGGLPLWDTTETLFFFIAGISTGVVLGFLFPSIWRTFRRKFRNISKFEASQRIKPLLNPIIKPFIDDESSNIELSSMDIASKFVLANNLVQLGYLRESISYYLEILGDSLVSKQDTNRAFFELSQVYESIELLDKAFDLAFELLTRKPKHELVFNNLLSLSLKFPDEKRYVKVLNTWKGNLNKNTRLKISSGLCYFGEIYLNKNQIQSAKKIAEQATRWNLTSGRARLLLWQARNKEIFENSSQDVSLSWVILLADIVVRTKIQQETGISPAASAEYLGSLLIKMYTLDPSFEIFTKMTTEFKQMLANENMSKETKTAFCSILFYAAITKVSSNLFERVALITDLLETSFEKTLGKSFRLCQSEDLKVVVLGFRVHICKICKAAFSDFEWECGHCHSFESLIPKLIEQY